MCDGQSHERVRCHWQSYLLVGAEQIGAIVYALVQCPFCESTLYAEAKPESLADAMTRLERSCELLKQAIGVRAAQKAEAPTASILTSSTLHSVS